ncbi:MAG: ABC transporter permease [Burkholderiaceae bacterium]|nr:ABC transporter permease [Burkholderiaceae bacterium]MCD8517901.1 ABC transporter permease [Burkholderiaceae bacterium]MCD8536519.1 ABC transporter permease [Burkholderiaceae bacterium]MCD8565359.1 ABC transporter permease [Burkholderiaceae bacterium]
MAQAQSLPQTSSPLIQDGDCWRVGAGWDVQTLSAPGVVKQRRQALRAASLDASWVLEPTLRLDSIGAQLLWDRWGRQLPQTIELTDTQRRLFDMLAAAGEPDKIPKPKSDWLGWIRHIGDGVAVGAHHGERLLVLLGGLVMDLVVLLARPLRGPWKEISAQIYRTGAQALGITALVGFLIGVVISYLSAQQLALFGAGQFIVKLLGVSIVRELGPVLAAILVAGRSGSAITAQIGVMRVTQELDAMQVMGISHGQRLILPRVIALAIVMPLLVLWTDVMALLGGMLAAHFELGLQFLWFVQQLPDAVGLTNYWIGLIKGVTFGAWIALVACHFGLKIEPNTESLGKGTTASVVTAITGVILIDAIYAVIFSEMGI